MPFLIDVSAQCIVKLDVTRISVLMPATNAGRWKPAGGQTPVDAVVDDAVEEVDGEERAEEHDLRRDEEEHAEHRGETREL